jgi:hypothetical protein
VSRNFKLKEFKKQQKETLINADYRGQYYKTFGAKLNKRHNLEFLELKGGNKKSLKTKR